MHNSKLLDKIFANSRAKLTSAQILAIRSDPRLHKAIAAEYSISKATVQAIKARRLWAHLADGALVA